MLTDGDGRGVSDAPEEGVRQFVRELQKAPPFALKRRWSMPRVERRSRGTRGTHRPAAPAGRRKSPTEKIGIPRKWRRGKKPHHFVKFSAIFGFVKRKYR